MLLTIDIGNTNINFGFFVNQTLIAEARRKTNSKSSDKTFANFIIKTTEELNIKKSEINECTIASVVPAINSNITKAIIDTLNITPTFVTHKSKLGMKIKTIPPEKLGTDLICDAVAAKSICSLPCIIIDLGTVTKILALNKDGDFIGGAFFPGIKAATNALTKSAAQLHKTKIAIPNSVIGNNTTDAILSGLIHGTASMIEGMLEKFEEELGKSDTIATGGYFELIAPYMKRKIRFHKYLVLEGLRIIHSLNPHP